MLVLTSCDINSDSAKGKKKNGTLTGGDYPLPSLNKEKNVKGKNEPTDVLALSRYEKISVDLSLFDVF